jgi:hypothetical protein
MGEIRPFSIICTEHRSVWHCTWHAESEGNMGYPCMEPLAVVGIAAWAAKQLFEVQAASLMRGERVPLVPLWDYGR